MILLAVLAVTLLLLGTLVAAARFAFAEPSRTLRVAFVGWLAVAAAVAVACAFFVEYQPRPTLRVRGVPLPSQTLQLENGHWVPFEGPGWILNLVIVTAGVAMPLSIPLIVRGYRRRAAARTAGFDIVRPGGRGPEAPGGAG